MAEGKVVKRTDTEHKLLGCFRQKDKGYFTSRVRFKAGTFQTEEMRRLLALAEKFGNGEIHLTSRQTVHVLWISEYRIEEYLTELAEVGLSRSSSGTTVRNTMGCLGGYTCKNGWINAQEMAQSIDQGVFGATLSMRKIKIAVSGCPNACSDPVYNEIGIVGRVVFHVDREKCIGCGRCVTSCIEGANYMLGKKSYRIDARCIKCGDCIRVCPTEARSPEAATYSLYLGGRMGRHPRAGVLVADLKSAEEVLSAVERLIRVAREVGEKGERLDQTIDRVGIQMFVRAIEHGTIQGSAGPAYE